MTQYERSEDPAIRDDDPIVEPRLETLVPREATSVELDQLSLTLEVDLTEDEPHLRIWSPEEFTNRLETAPRWQLMSKRAIDVTVALVAIVVLSPLMLLTATAVALTSPGPVFFAQLRVGYMGEPFTFLKFRSMYRDADQRKNELSDRNQFASGPVFKVQDDPRMTPIGTLIRRFSIDELPQLLHVLQGKMSLVGPRPLPLADVLAHTPERDLSDRSKYVTHDLLRLTAKPGITGIWQVSGRSELPYETWASMDMEYLETWSPWLDLEILAKTVPAVLSGRGAY